MRASHLVLCLAAAGAGLLPVQARPWKPTLQQQAQDYSTINHNKGAAAGRVVLNWLSAPGFTGALSQILDKYVVLSITHTVIAPEGLVEYQDIEGVQVTDQDGHDLKPVQAGDYPPTIIAMITAVETSLRQSTQGKGKIKNLVFDAGAVHACARNGGLVVTFEGERYTWDTPMPGCAASQ